VIDLTFSPFDDNLLFTGSEDSTIRGWRVPDGGLTANESNPVVELKGHSKKVGILAFHPSAENVLASAGMDNTIHLWDATTSSAKAVLKGFSSEQILSLNWNLDGSLLNVTTRDKKLSILDARTGSVVASADSHQGSKNQRSVWAKRKNMIVTVGFDKSQRREVMVWDCRSLAKAVHSEELDQASSVMMPFYDEDTSMVYIGSKGDGTIRYFELCAEAPILQSCSTYASADPAKGLAMMPKRSLDVKQCEIARFYFLGAKSLYPLRMILPRVKAETEFQEDVYVPTFAAEPSITAADFFEGKKNAEPKVMNLRGLFDGTSCSVSAAAPTEAAFSPVRHDEPSVDQGKVDAARKAVEAAKEKVALLRSQLEDAEKDVVTKEAELAALDAATEMSQ
jgi:coronin-1B/1C/6